MSNEFQGDVFYITSLQYLGQVLSTRIICYKVEAKEAETATFYIWTKFQFRDCYFVTENWAVVNGENGGFPQLYKVCNVTNKGCHREEQNKF